MGSSYSVVHSRKQPHKAPLAPRALAVLNEARQLSRGEGLILLSLNGKVRSDAILAHAVNSKVEAAWLIDHSRVGNP